MNRLAEEAAYFAAVDAGRDSAQEEIDQLRAVNKELLEALTALTAACLDIAGRVRKPTDAAVHSAATAIAHAKAKGQGGE